MAGDTTSRPPPPSVVMAAAQRPETGFNPRPVSLSALSGLGGTAADENGATAQTYK